MTVKQSGETQGESDCKAERGNSRRKSDCHCLFLVLPEIFYYCPVSHSISPRFWPVFWPKSTRNAALFFSSLFFCFIFLFPVYFSGKFWFFCLFFVPPIFSLFLVPPAKVTVKQSGETQGESDCKAERGNSRRNSDCNCLLSVPPKNILFLPSFPFDFASFLAEVFPARCPFFPQPLFGIFSCFLVFFG